MNGRPVWLASLSRRTNDGKMIPTGRWMPHTIAEMTTILRDKVLAGAGDPKRERCFRMNITLCIHRALTDDEIARLPDDWHDAPGTALAGGPIELLWEHGCGGSMSTRPCRNPRKYMMGGPSVAPEDTWVPLDCGKCDTCLARASCLPLEVRMRYATGG